MDLLKKFQQTIKSQTLTSKLMIAGFILIGAACLALPAAHSKNEVPTALPNEPATPSVDTMIPSGYVLVPIEISNSNSLSSLLGEMGGVVDLYLPQGKKNSLKVASKLKILRAPYNPDLYAVLVREQEGSRIMSYTGPFIAVVQNPTERGQHMIDNHIKKISIDYQN